MLRAVAISCITDSLCCQRNRRYRHRPSGRSQEWEETLGWGGLTSGMPNKAKLRIPGEREKVG